jgi:putative flippase GtrA
VPLSPDRAPPDSERPDSERVSLYDRLRRHRLVSGVLRIPIVNRVLSPSRGDGAMPRFIRYSLVSGVAIVISQLTILICTWLFGLSGIAANTIGALAATPASYELNRRWAWGKSGRSHVWREMVPFWSLTLLGWLASTGTVEIADSMAKSHHVVGLGRSVAIMGASLFAYGVVWIVKFVIFNRLVFVDRGTVTGTGTAPSAATSSLAPPAPAPAPGGTAVVVAPVAARPAQPAWEGPARAGR